MPANRIRDNSGEIVTTDGTVVGTHPGIENFTIGQRKGLGVALGEPQFVVRIEPESRRVVLGHKSELGRRPPDGQPYQLAGRSAGPADFAAMPRFDTTVRPRPRRPKSCPATVSPCSLTIPSTGSPRARPWFAMTGDRVLGGGWID